MFECLQDILGHLGLSEPTSSWGMLEGDVGAINVISPWLYHTGPKKRTHTGPTWRCSQPHFIIVSGVTWEIYGNIGNHGGDHRGHSNFFAPWGWAWKAATHQKTPVSTWDQWKRAARLNWATYVEELLGVNYLVMTIMNFISPRSPGQKHRFRRCDQPPEKCNEMTRPEPLQLKKAPALSSLQADVFLTPGRNSIFKGWNLFRHFSNSVASLTWKMTCTWLDTFFHYVETNLVPDDPHPLGS